MNSKRMLAITVFGAVFIALFIGVMLLLPYLRRDTGNLTLPETEVSATSTGDATDSDGLSRIEITRENVQAVIATLTLARPESYTREISIESYWDGSSAVYKIETAVSGGVTSLKKTGGGVVKRIIITQDRLFVWNDGDARPLERTYGPSDDWRREADEWQMLPTYEDVLSLPVSAITDAGYVEFGGEDCIYVACKTGRLGYTARYYISVALGLLAGVEEFSGDAPDSPLTYKMTTGSFLDGEPDASAFLLPDGSSAIFGP